MESLSSVVARTILDAIVAATSRGTIILLLSLLPLSAHAQVIEVHVGLTPGVHLVASTSFAETTIALGAVVLTH